MSRIYKINRISKIFGFRCIESRVAGFPKRCRCVRALILRISEIVIILLRIYKINRISRIFGF